jgi:plasmid stability protein
MKAITIRNVPNELARALKKETQRRGTSLNKTVLDLLSQSLGLGWGRTRHNGLARLAGTWSEQDYDAFESAIASMEQIDEELWG